MTAEWETKLSEVEKGTLVFGTNQGKIYKINLKRDIINASVAYSTTDKMIKKYGKYHVLDIDV